MRTFTISLLIALAGCAGNGSGNSPVNPPVLGDGTGDGFQRIAVSQPDGTVDDVWIYASSPADGTDLPVVIYAHGQGPTGVTNCAPGDVGGVGHPGAEYCDDLADQGFLAIAIFYRHTGDGAPGVGSVKLRDHHIRDARTMLAAAQWARQNHGRGSSRVALIGSSMGTWTTMWAASTLPEVADLQAGLDIRTIVLQGETGNHLANASDTCDEHASTDSATRAQYIVGKVYGAVQLRSMDLGMGTITAADLAPGGALADSLADVLTPRGIALASELFVSAADTALAGCQNLDDVGPMCSQDCIGSTVLELWDADPETLDATDWLLQPAIDAACAFNPPAIDPGPDHDNPLIASMRAYSPVYAADGLIAPRALPLLALGDSHYIAEAFSLLLDRLTELGVALPDEIHTPGMDCGHGDYRDPRRPHCGWDATLDELMAAFSD